MSESVGAHGQGQGRQAESIDLSALERVEAELDAVERALEQIDQGVYEGFTGLGDSAALETDGPEDDAPARYV